MATLKLGEVVLDAAIAKLKAGYANRVSEINTEKNDGITITAPDTTDFYLGGVSEIPRAPAVIVTQLPTQEDAEQEGPHSFIWVGVVGVYVLEEATDRQQLARKLQRQIRAVVEILWDDSPQEALSGSAFMLKFVRDDPGPVSDPTDDSSFWRGFHSAFFRAHQSEN